MNTFQETKNNIEKVCILVSVFLWLVPAEPKTVAFLFAYLRLFFASQQQEGCPAHTDVLSHHALLAIFFVWQVASWQASGKTVVLLDGLRLDNPCISSKFFWTAQTCSCEAAQTGLARKACHNCHVSTSGNTTKEGKAMSRFHTWKHDTDHN